MWSQHLWWRADNFRASKLPDKLCNIFLTKFLTRQSGERRSCSAPAVNKTDVNRKSTHDSKPQNIISSKQNVKNSTLRGSFLHDRHFRKDGGLSVLLSGIASRMRIKSPVELWKVCTELRSKALSQATQLPPWPHGEHRWFQRKLGGKHFASKKVGFLSVSLQALAGAQSVCLTPPGGARRAGVGKSWNAENNVSKTLCKYFLDLYIWQLRKYICMENLEETINVFMQMDESTYSMKLQAAVLQRIDLLGLGLARIFLLWVNSFCGFVFVLWIHLHDQNVSWPSKVHKQTLIAIVLASHTSVSTPKVTPFQEESKSVAQMQACD